MLPTFNNPDLLMQALTHPSCAQQKKGVAYNNQRLEFLGDAVLGMVIARMLYEMYPNEQEGELARRYAGLVCGEQLMRIAKIIGLDKKLHVSPSEAEAGGCDNPSNLEDAMEAVIGALYLDSGIDAVESFIDQHFKELAASITEPPKDPKTGLQEWAQARALPLPEYKVISETGPAHAPVFAIEVSVQGHMPAGATARSKKLAEREAAAELLARLL